MGVSTETNFEGIKVVIIDDSRTIRRTITTLLTKVGCETVTASDGFEGLCKIMELQPDIILLDNMMPRLDGYQTCTLIRSNPIFYKTPIIMLASSDGLSNRIHSRIAGVTHYTAYPLTCEEILNIIKAYVVDVKRARKNKSD
jgi:twitching motility two-component system response regulator PilG